MSYRRPIAVIDSESDPFKVGRIPKPFIWGFYDGGFMDENKPYYEFDTVEELVEFLRDKEYIVYAHNGGKFDYHYMLPFIEPFDEIMIINGRLAKFHIGICEFRDSFNIVPVPMAEYQKTEIDYSIFEPEERVKPENREKIRSYLFDDCRFLFDLVSKFVERFGVQLTQAGASMRQWQKISGLKSPNSSAEYYAEFHPYYYGGRCECFEVGLIEEPFESIDINSAYPRAMLERHPYYLEFMTLEGDTEILDFLKTAPRNEIGPAFFKVKAVSRGAFPFRDIDKSLWFPRDDEPREYYVTGWELLAAEDTMTAFIMEYQECRYFETLVSFSDYVYQFYNERKTAAKNGDKAGKLFGKLFMNSLYGKFAMNPDEFSEYAVFDPDLIGYLDESNREKWIEYKEKPFTFAGELGPFVLGRADLDEEQKRYYNIATAASVTGWVRAYLWRAAQTCDGLIYMDTDSITARKTGPVEIGPELGQWEVEGRYTRGGVAGKKLYAFKYRPGTGPIDKKTGKRKGWKLASKGVKLNARQILRVARGGKVTYNPEVPTYSVYRKPQFVQRDIISTGKTSDMKSEQVKARDKLVDNPIEVLALLENDDLDSIL